MDWSTVHLQTKHQLTAVTIFPSSSFWLLKGTMVIVTEQHATFSQRELCCDMYSFIHVQSFKLISKLNDLCISKFKYVEQLYCCVMYASSKWRGSWKCTDPNYLSCMFSDTLYFRSSSIVNQKWRVQFTALIKCTVRSIYLKKKKVYINQRFRTIWRLTFMVEERRSSTL